MKKIVVSLVVVLVAVVVVVTVATRNRKSTVRTREWPMGLGRLDTVPARYPKAARTPAATELEQLAAKTVHAKGPDPIADYVRAQLQRVERAIDPAPLLPENVPAIRAVLLSGRPIAWDVDINGGANSPRPNLNVQRRVSRLLTASALDRARLGDAGAWDDLHAQRVLSLALWQRPELISAIIAMSIDRNVIAAARKMPLPAPAWFAELRTFDHRKAMLTAMQADTWMLSASIRDDAGSDGAAADGAAQRINQLIDGTYVELSSADLIARQRELATEIAELTTCTVDVPAPTVSWWNPTAEFLMPNVIGAWARVFRLRAELELAEHALGLRSGPNSRCSDGHWIVTASSVKFSKPIPLGRAPGVIPLELKQ